MRDKLLNSDPDRTQPPRNRPEASDESPSAPPQNSVTGLTEADIREIQNRRIQYQSYLDLLRFRWLFLFFSGFLFAMVWFAASPSNRGVLEHPESLVSGIAIWFVVGAATYAFGNFSLYTM